MATLNLSLTGSVVLDGSGNGQVSFSVPYRGVEWYPTNGVCNTSTSVKTPVFNVYQDAVVSSNLAGGSMTGSNDNCTLSGTLYVGNSIIGVWTGGDAGAKATFNLIGTQKTPGP